MIALTMDRRIFSSTRQILDDDPPHIPGVRKLSSTLLFFLESTSISMVSGKRRKAAETFTKMF